MSFILDALRKSERDRQRNQEPGLAELRTHGKQGNRAFWVPLVLLLVGLNISLLVFLWIKGSPPVDEFAGPGSDTAAELTEPVAASRPPAMPAVREDPATRQLSAEIPDSAGTEQTPANPATPASVAASPPTRRSSDNDYRNLPTFMELAMAGSLGLKPLHLDIHVFSQQPANRFVFINTAKYREGETLTDGPRVEEITPGGVVLEYQGRRFILARE